jgi:hypothetical protein
MLKKALFLLLAAGAVAAVLAWPRIYDVETGKTPEYPDLKPRGYAAPEAEVVRATREAVSGMRDWRLIGSGRGPGGSEVRAVRALPVIGLEYEVTVRIRRSGSRTEVAIRSRSKRELWDFGQNARNVRALLLSLDRSVR